MIGWIVFGILLLCILVSVFFLFYDKIHYYFEKTRHRKRIYKVLHYFAEEEDCYLLNDAEFFLSENDAAPTHFDHLLFTEKYVYIITDFMAFGGIYGNVNDASLFLRKDSGKIVTIPNPVLNGRERVRRIEELVGASHEKKLFMSMTVYNPSLVVPKSIHIKDGESNFISLKELDETIRLAEQDNVAPIKDEMTKKLVHSLYERSNKTKESIRETGKRRK